MSALVATSPGVTVATEGLPCQPFARRARFARLARCTGSITCARMERTAIERDLTRPRNARRVTHEHSVVEKVGTFLVFHRSLLNCTAL